MRVGVRDPVGVVGGGAAGWVADVEPAGDVLAGTVVDDAGGGDEVAVATGLGGAVVTLPGVGDAVAAGPVPRVTPGADVPTDGSPGGAG